MKADANRQAAGVFALMIMSILLFYASSAYGHKVYIFAWTEGGMIYTESYFSGNRKVQDGTVKVFDMEGKELVSGRTNDNGEFSFKIPEITITDLRIVLESSAGHGAEYLLKRSEISPDLSTSQEAVNEAEVTEEPETPLITAAGQDRLRQEIEAALDAKLKPIVRELAKLREDRGPGVTEVIGGIGYILGIMGIVAYMKSRKK